MRSAAAPIASRKLANEPKKGLLRALRREFHRLPTTQHQRAQFCVPVLPLWSISDDFPFEHDSKPAAQKPYFVQICRDKEHSRSPIPQFAQLAVDELGRADIQASGGLRGNEQP